jgi:acyl-CoA thioester hydrolase
LAKGHNLAMSFSEPTYEVIRVRFSETDRMGHAHHSSYFPWLEQARGAWCRDRGFDYKDLESMGYGLPVVECWVKYRGEAEYDDQLVIEIRLDSIKRTFLTFNYSVKNGSGQVITEAWTRHALMNSERKAVSVPPEVMAMLEGRRNSA